MASKPADETWLRPHQRDRHGTGPEPDWQLAILVDVTIPAPHLRRRSPGIIPGRGVPRQ